MLWSQKYFQQPFSSSEGLSKKWNFTGYFKNHYSCHRFVVITVPKVLFDKTLKFLLVMRGNSSHFQALSWKLNRVPRVYTDLISGVSPAIFKILPEIPWDYLQGQTVYWLADNRHWVWSCLWWSEFSYIIACSANHGHVWYSNLLIPSILQFPTIMAAINRHLLTVSICHQHERRLQACVDGLMESRIPALMDVCFPPWNRLTETRRKSVSQSRLCVWLHGTLVGVWCKDGDVKESTEMGDSDSPALVLVRKG